MSSLEVRSFCYLVTTQINPSGAGGQNPIPEVSKGANHEGPRVKSTPAEKPIWLQAGVAVNTEGKQQKGMV